MPTIVALNPGKKKKKKAGKKKRKKMTPKQIKYFGTKRQKAALKAKKKKKPAAKKTASKSKGKVKKKMAKGKKKTYKKRYNPRGGGGGGGQIARVTVGALKSSVPLLFGALCAKFTAKKFAEGGAESDNWTYKNYLLALLGGSIAAFATGAILRKQAVTQKVLEGAMLLIGYKIFTNEIATQNQSLESWFGQDDFDPYAGLSDGMGDIWQAGSSNYVRGVDGMWRPADDAHRRLPMRAMRRGGAGAGRMPWGYRRGIRKGMGDVLVTPDARYGDVLVTPDARYGETPSARKMAEAIEADGM